MSRNSPLKTLHLFNKYLPPTQNWLYNLLKHLPDTEIHIGANLYLKNNFYNPAFHYVNHPFGELWEYDISLDKKKLPDLLKKIVLKTFSALIGSSEKSFLKYAKENKIELVHAHFADTAWKYRRVARKLNLPLVISFYGWDYEKLPHLKPEYRKRFQSLFRQAARLICEGEHGAAVLVGMGCPEHKISVVRLGVNVDKIPFFHRQKEAGQLKLIQVATFTEKKGHIYSVKAFEAAIRRCPNIHLTLLGDNREPGIKQEVLNYISKNGLGEKISVLDAIPFDQLHAFLKDFHVFIHPSCYARDRDCEGGAPIVLLDAQATGMPVIATRHCDIPGEVIDGKTGILVPEKDVEALNEAIRFFYEMSTEEYHEFCRKARNHIESSFDSKLTSAMLEEVYLLGLGEK